MPPEETEGGDEPFIGFRSYADDTPRELPEATAAARDIELRLADRRGSRRGGSGRSGLWGVLVAVVLVGAAALSLGLFLGRQGRDDRTIALNTPGATAPATVPAGQPLAMAAVSAPKPIGTQPAAGSPQTSGVSPPPAPQKPAPPRPAAQPDRLARLAAELPAGGQPSPASAASPAGVSSAPTVPASQPAELAAASEPQSLPLESCRRPRTRTERLVCNDPELAAEDRRLAEVYRAAIAAGAPRARLAREQSDWLKAREEASRHSRQEVQTLYASRIDDLAHWLDDAHAAGLRP